MVPLYITSTVNGDKVTLFIMSKDVDSLGYQLKQKGFCYPIRTPLAKFNIVRLSPVILTLIASIGDRGDSEGRGVSHWR